MRVLALALALVLGTATTIGSPWGASAVPAHAADAPASAQPVYVSPDLSDGKPAPQPVAGAWIVADMDSGQEFAGSATDKQLAPASTIKLLTALALIDVLDPEDRYTVVYEDMLVDGTKVGLMQENTYRIDTLFHAMLMASANDAAHALGNAVGGQAKAVELMNAKAAELGMTGTVARNTSGLDAEGQVMTVTDLLIVSKAVMENDYLMRVIGTETMDFPGHDLPSGEHVPGYQIQNHTKIVGAVPGGIGMKNGYTRAAGGSFVAVVERDGRTYGAAVLGAANKTRESSVDLIEWAYNQAELPDLGTVPLTPEEAGTDSSRGAARGEDAAGARAGGDASGAVDTTAEAASADETTAPEAAAAGQGMPLPARSMLVVLGALVLAAGGFVLLMARRAAARESGRHRSHGPKH